MSLANSFADYTPEKRLNQNHLLEKAVNCCRDLFISVGKPPRVRQVSRARLDIIIRENPKKSVEL